jgi:hypothetical protein
MKCGLYMFSSVHPAFLSLLFTYRKTFHAIAARALSPGATISTVVCWVDAVLAHLGEAAMKVAHARIRRQDHSEHHHGLENLRRQSEDNNLRAAAQLPGKAHRKHDGTSGVTESICMYAHTEKWQSVPGVISSELASPAAKRLALRLTFAIYVIRPQFVDCDPWYDDEEG